MHSLNFCFLKQNTLLLIHSYFNNSVSTLETFEEYFNKTYASPLLFFFFFLFGLTESKAFKTEKEFGESRM